MSESCERVYKKLMNDYADGNYDVILSVDDIANACYVLLQNSSDEFKKSEINNMLFKLLGDD